MLLRTLCMILVLNAAVYVAPIGADEMSPLHYSIVFVNDFNGKQVEVLNEHVECDNHLLERICDMAENEHYNHLIVYNDNLCQEIEKVSTWLMSLEERLYEYELDDVYWEFRYSPTPDFPYGYSVAQYRTEIPWDNSNNCLWIDVGQKSKQNCFSIDEQRDLNLEQFREILKQKLESGKYQQMVVSDSDKRYYPQAKEYIAEFYRVIRTAVCQYDIPCRQRSAAGCADCVVVTITRKWSQNE